MHPPSYKGRNFGIVVLVVIQSIIGSIHVVFGIWLLFATNDSAFLGFTLCHIYSWYTLLYGVSILVFSVGLWLKKNWGWYGTLAVSFFVIVADLLRILDLPSVPGIPKLAGVGEIPYSIVVVAYLMQSHIITEYGRKKEVGK